MGGAWHAGSDINDVSLSGTIPREFTGLTQRRRLSSANSLENNSAYQACIASSSTCTALCVPPRPRRRMRVARAQLSSHEAAVAASV
jgi:hypothetical protein